MASSLRLNTLKPAAGSRRVHLRVGRAASAGQGKTSGRGVKGQRARKGGYHKVGFESGQMPLQRRMPKVGFRSAMKATRVEVRLDELNKVEGAVIDLEALKKANVVPAFAVRAKVILSGELKKAVTLKGVLATKGAAAAIEKLGGKVEVDEAAQTAAASLRAAKDKKRARRVDEIQAKAAKSEKPAKSKAPKADKAERADKVEKAEKAAKSEKSAKARKSE